MAEQSREKQLDAREFAARLAANKFVSVSDNRLKTAEEYEAFDFLVKRSAEAEAFEAANFAETDALLRRGVEHVQVALADVQPEPLPGGGELPGLRHGHEAVQVPEPDTAAEGVDRGQGTRGCGRGGRAFHNKNSS